MAIKDKEKAIEKLNRARAEIESDLQTAEGSLKTIRERIGAEIVAGKNARKAAGEVREAELYRDGLAAALGEMDRQIAAAEAEIVAARQAAEREKAEKLAREFDSLLAKMEQQLAAFSSPGMHGMADSIRLAVANAGNENRERALARARMHAATTIDSNVREIHQAIAQWKRLTG